uniref:Corticotropin-releasing factor domain-containing protein n=1 Tax=Scophthalmus maximus TaxID=52904 RepID=A0A8D3EEN8_SCOMX
MNVWKDFSDPQLVLEGVVDLLPVLLLILLLRLHHCVEMKINVLLWFVAVIGIFLPRSADCRPAIAAAGRPHLLLPRPLLLHLGEELSLKLGGGGPDLSSSSSSEEEEEEEAGEKRKRSDEPPISLDLTFHLLREVLELARAEQIALQAHSNRKMMDTFGK